MDYSEIYIVLVDAVKICFPIAFVVNMIQLLVNMFMTAAFGGKLKVK